jgi:DNA-binding beta-propeller fold protein YncE
LSLVLTWFTQVFPRTMPSKLRVQWLVSLDLDCGGSVTNTLISNAVQQYAASWSKGFRFDRMGVLVKNELPDLGNHEVQLAALTDSSQLIIGTHGVVRGLDPTTLAQLWQCDLPNAGHEIVTPFYIGKYAYAATNGCVFRIDTTNGHILGTNGLPGRGNHETRISSTAGATKLIVGINGWALLHADTVSNTIWQMSLPGSGLAVTTVTSGTTGVYVAYNGHVYLLDLATSTVLRQNDLPDKGDHYTSLAVSRDGSLLYVGIHG